MNELMFTGLQVVGCALMCLAAGAGIGVFGWDLFSAENGRGQNKEKE